MNNIIISFSGIDGSGKTSLAHKVAVELNARGYAAEYCKPDYVVNEIIKTFCHEEFGDEFSYIPNLNGSLYIYGILIDWIDTLNKKLRDHAGKILVFDRYVYDILSQGLHYKANIQPMIEMIKFFPEPDISFFIDISPENAYERLTNRLAPPMHQLESLENLKVLDQSYITIFNSIPWRRIHISDKTNFNSIMENIISKL